jgi:hypothetical protein
MFSDIQCGPNAVETSTVRNIERAIRKAIADRKESKYATAKGAKLDYASFVRFLDGNADVRLSTVEALVEYLGLELKPRSKRG